MGKSKIPIDIKIRLRALKLGIELKNIADQLENENGVKISQQRFCDMIKGRRPHDFNRYKDQIAEILGLKSL